MTAVEKKLRFACEVGAISLSSKWATRDALGKLCALPPNEVIVVDPEGEEVKPDEHGSFTATLNSLPHTQFFVASESFIAASDSEDDDKRVRSGELTVEQAQLRTMRRRRARAERLFQRAQHMERARREFIAAHYQPLHPEFYASSFNMEDMLEPGIIAALRDGKADSIRAALKRETETGAYSFPCFTRDFCRRLMEELDHYEASGLPASRPNSMNRYGLILDEIGMTPLLTFLRERLVQPLSDVFYAHFNYGTLDDHHGFVVQYRLGEDVDLGFHYDASEVTLNVCLGREFTAGMLYFCGLLDDASTHTEDFQYEHHVGRGLLHIGKHRHGAHPITSGERTNLILWCRNKEIRAREEERQRAAQCGCSHDHGHSHAHDHGHSHGGHAHAHHDDDDDDGDSGDAGHTHSHTHSHSHSHPHSHTHGHAHAHAHAHGDAEGDECGFDHTLSAAAAAAAIGVQQTE